MQAIDKGRTPAEKPNILFVFVDQMRASVLGCAGIESVFTPNLDRFAEEGTRFIRAIANTPVCSPARASIITGLHTLSHGLVFNDLRLRTDIKSIAHCLNEAGYKSGYIGKWHLDCADRGAYIPPGPARQGFDDYWAVNNCNHSYLQSYYYLNGNPEPVWIDGYEPQAQTDLAVGYLAEKPRENEPFCLFLSWGAPHCPYLDVPKGYLALYPEESIRLKPNADPSADKKKIVGYYAHITALDACFGQLMQALTDRGLRENSIVVFTSDHGDMLFSHNRGWKCKPWAESIGIPMIMRWPGHIPAGRINRGLMSLVDTTPTLLSLAGIAIPPGVEGLDLSALVRGDEDSSPGSIFINLPVSPLRYSFREWRGVVTKRHTYARFRDESWILYDDENDPHQLHNLTHSPAHAELKMGLERILENWLARLRDPFASTMEVAEKYYPGSVNGEMPYYENETIRQGKIARLNGVR